MYKSLAPHPAEKLWHAPLMVALMLCACPSITFGQSTDWGQALRTNAPKVWAEYAEKARRLPLQYESKQWTRNVQGEYRSEPAEVFQTKRNSAGTRLLALLDNNSYSRCLGLNEKYAFVLARKKPGDPWIITNVVSDLTNIAANPAFQNLQVKQGGVWAAPPTDLHEYGPLGALIGEPGFSIEKAESFSRDGLDLLRFHFLCQRFAGDSKYQGSMHYERGWFIVEPSRHWRLLEYEALVNYRGRTKTSAVFHGAIEYVDGPERMPLLRSSLIRIKAKTAALGSPHAPPQDFEAEVKTDFRVEARECAAEEFRLSGFGFPEPPGVEWKQPIPLFVWLGLGAFGALIFAIMITWLRQRSTTPRAT
jgi:hypothetical protein